MSWLGLQNWVMRPIQVKQLDYDLTPAAGLALVGHLLRTLTPVLSDVDAALPVRTGVATSDIVRSDLGLLVQGKSNFDTIENLRGDKFFKQSLGIGLLPSSPGLRQRMDASATDLAEQVLPMVERLLAHHVPDYGTLPCGWLPLDIDTFAMDNSGTAKEGVGRTYVGVDGYCARWRRTWARTASAWTWRCGPARNTRPSTPTMICAASGRWRSGSAPPDQRRRCSHGWTRASTLRR